MRKTYLIFCFVITVMLFTLSCSSDTTDTTPTLFDENAVTEPFDINLSPGDLDPIRLNANETGPVQKPSASIDPSLYEIILEDLYLDKFYLNRVAGNYNVPAGFSAWAGVFVDDGKSFNASAIYNSESKTLAISSLYHFDGSFMYQIKWIGPNAFRGTWCWIKTNYPNRIRHMTIVVQKGEFPGMNN